MGFKKAPVLGGIPMVVRLGYFSSIPLAIYLIQKIPVWL